MILFCTAKYCDIPLHVSALAAAAGLLHGITEARACILLLELHVNFLHHLCPRRRLARSLAAGAARHTLATRSLTSCHVVLLMPLKIYAAASDPET